VTLPAALGLAGQASDDGLPNPPGTMSCTWSKIVGPGNVLFAPDANMLDAEASFDGEGFYSLRLRCSDSALVTSDLVGVTVTRSTPPPDPGTVGWATVNTWGQNGTTGGAGGPTVTVSTAAELLAAIVRPGPYVIHVNGMVTLPGDMHNVTSDKTIVGLGSTSGITGGGLNIGINTNDNITAPPANAVKNVIIRNLVFRGFPDDAINVQMFSHHVWIDHNDMSNANDGLIDIKRGSSYITVSWNHMHHHVKNMLLGHDDGSGPQDIGHLKVTYHHNWFDGTSQRNPRVRFGEPVHVFNNFYFGNADVGVACQANGGCWVEGNSFENVEEPMTPYYAGPAGRIFERLNLFVNSGPPIVLGTVEDPGLSYAYTLDDAAAVKTIVTAGAGVGRLEVLPSPAG
jgi:pectate lyase